MPCSPTSSESNLALRFRHRLQYMSKTYSAPPFPCFCVLYLYRYFLCSFFSKLCFLQKIFNFYTAWGLCASVLAHLLVKRWSFVSFKSFYLSCLFWKCCVSQPICLEGGKSARKCWWRTDGTTHFRSTSSILTLYMLYLFIIYCVEHTGMNFHWHRHSESNLFHLR